MKQIHNLEKQQFKKLFKQEQIDNIDDRYKILEIFLETERHITQREFEEIIRGRGINIDSDLLRDTLELMCGYGFAEKKSFSNGEVFYEHRHLGEHHDHMVCTKCGCIIEFEDAQIERLQLEVAEKYGFHMLTHDLLISGICSDCQKKRVALMPLMLAKPGERLRISDLQGCSKMQKRLTDMGLRVGDVIEVITSQGRGQFVIALENKRYILGRGLSSKIKVEVLKA